MNSRERILAAINHKEADRVPVDFGSSMVTSIHKLGYERLKDYLKFNEEPETEIARGRSLVAKVHPKVQDILGVDARMLIVNSPDGWKQESVVEGKDGTVDEWGLTWVCPEGIDNYDITHSPLFGQDITVNDVKAMKWPDAGDKTFLKGLREKTLALRESSDKAIVANLAMQIHTQSYFIRGFTDYLIDIVVNPKLIESIMDNVLEVFMERTKNIMNEIGDIVDVVYVADDLGIQTGPLFPPQLYRSILKPRQAKLFEVIKKNSQAKILFHSCGSIVDFIDDLAEIGVDILNPVQVSANKMDTKELKQRFGDKICFWGGIDTHRVLPFGTPAEVKEEVKRRIEDLATGGGFVAAAVHNIRPEVPPENIVAMTEAIHEFGKY